MVSCTSDGTMDLSYFVVESSDSSNEIVRLRTSAGAYLSVQDDPAVVAKKVDSNTVIDSLDDIKFIATVVTPKSDDDGYEMSNPLSFEYVSFRSVANNRLISVSGNRGSVELVDDSKEDFNAASTLFQTNFQQACH